nr:hypothetical protein [Tanacetum cinerariifolium]
DNDDLDSSDDESLPDEDVPAEDFKIYSNLLCDENEINSDKLDPHCFNVESDFVESLLNRELNVEIADTIIESIPLPIPVQDGNSQQEEIDIVTEIDDVLPPSDENDDDLSDDLILGEAHLFLDDNQIPPGIKNVADDPEGDIHFLEELLIDGSILSDELSDANFEDNSSIPRPPPEPPDDNFDLEPEVISAVMEDIDEPDEHFNPGGEIFVSTNNENVDYFPFMFVIRIFLPYLILPEISPLFLSAESEDMIFDPESALDSKLLSINSINSQRLDKKEQEVKIVEEQPAECRNHAEKSLQNFRVIHKKSISLNSSQISSVHAVAPILSTKEPEHSLSMGYEHLSITPETESDEVTESNAENLLPIPSECEVTSEDKRECDELICENSSTIDVCDNHSEILFDSNNADLSSDDESFEDIEYVDASVLDTTIVNVEEENVVQREEEEPDVIAKEISDKLNEDKCFDPGGEIFVSTNNEDVDYFPFMFVIRSFLPYPILPEISPLFLSVESEDTIFDPGISD